MTDDERAAWMTPPPDLVRGCDSPEGVRILADWLDEHGGDGAEFREQMRDVGEMPRENYGNGDGCGDGYGNGNGKGDGTGYGFGPSFGDGYGSGSSDDYGTPDGDGGPDSRY